MATEAEAQAPAQSRGLTAAEAAALGARTRYRVLGGIMVALGLVGFWLFTQGIRADELSTFGLNQGGTTSAAKLPDLLLPTFATVAALSLLSVGLGAYQLWRSFGRRSTAMLGLVVLFFIIAFLTWATADKSLNLVGMLKGALLRAVPLTLGALSGILSERAGVVNIAIEGLMLSAAFMGVVVASATGSLWIGLLAAILTGALLALVHAVLSIRYKVDQVISGVVINIFSAGMTSFLSSRFLSEPQYAYLNSSGIFPTWAIPLLSRIPIIGGIFFESNLFTYGMFVMLVVVHLALFYTRWGLRTRAVGEHPKAADTLGINVYRMRYLAVCTSGALAGIGGAYLSVGYVGSFTENMTSGRGFIALAAVIFGKWRPSGMVGACLLFGFASALGDNLQTSAGISADFTAMLPYILTLVELVGFVGRSIPPRAVGIPYQRQ